MVLATKNTALADVINHPDCGIAVEHNAEIYTKELQRLLDNMDEVKERGNKSLDFAKSTYRNDLFFSRSKDIYTDVIRQHTLNTSDSEAKNIALVISQLKKYRNNGDEITVTKPDNQDLFLKKTYTKKFVKFLKIIIPCKAIRKKIRVFFNFKG